MAAPAWSQAELLRRRRQVAKEPSHEDWLEVARQLIGGGRHEGAVAVLTEGLQHFPEQRGARMLLARAAYADRQYICALAAATRVDPDPVEDVGIFRLRICALEKVGHLTEAREAAEQLLAIQPRDAVARAVLRRVVFAPSIGPRAGDPHLTLQRMEAYAGAGRVERALRMCRRLLAASLGDSELRARELELIAAVESDHAPIHDELSEELSDPMIVPPPLVIPTPGAFHEDFEEVEGDDEETVLDLALIPGRDQLVAAYEASGYVGADVPEEQGPVVFSGQEHVFEQVDEDLEETGDFEDEDDGEDATLVAEDYAAEIELLREELRRRREEEEEEEEGEQAARRRRSLIKKRSK